VFVNDPRAGYVTDPGGPAAPVPASVGVGPRIRGETVRILSTILLVLFLGAVAIFCVQNTGPVAVRFLGWGMTAPLPVVVLVVYLLGMMTGWAVLSFLRRSVRLATESPR